VPGARTYGDPCGVARSLDVIGERWALLVVRELMLGPKRFADLHRGMPTVSPNVLSQRLQALAVDGVVRHRRLGPPAHVQIYELTDWGRELEPVLLHLGRWGAAAPALPSGRLSLDSLMLSIKAAFDPARPGPPHATYEIRVDNDTFAITIADSAIEIRRATVGEADATLTTDADTLRALHAGRRTVSEARRAGDLRLDGNAPAVEQLTELILAAVTILT
jgi:DNA-binding HxlR family transcriptional regulator